jgi:hypothetical protein
MNIIGSSAFLRSRVTCSHASSRERIPRTPALIDAQILALTLDALQ